MQQGEPKPQGFMIYASDWETYLDDYSDEEIGKVFKALVAYFLNGENTVFQERSMRAIYRQAVKSIERDRQRYQLTCTKNAYNRYKAICMNRKEEPLSFEEWSNDRQESSTTVNDRQRPLRIVTNSNSNSNPNPNSNSNSNSNTNSNTNSNGNSNSNTEQLNIVQQEQGDDFEERRAAALNALKGCRHERTT